MKEHRRSGWQARTRRGTTLVALGGPLAVLLLALAAGVAGAAEQFPSGPNHRGVVEFEPYRLFPENRPGNAVYLDNLLVFETPDQTILDVLPAPADGRFIYYARTPQGAPVLGVATREGDGTPKVETVAPGFYHVVVQLAGVWYKKFYRIVDDNILDLLPSSKTADGPLAGPGGVVFYHVATAIRAGEQGQTQDGFGLGIHLALLDDERPRHLNYLIINTRPGVSFKWLDESRIEVGLADGRTEVITTSQFQ